MRPITCRWKIGRGGGTGAKGGKRLKKEENDQDMTVLTHGPGY